MSLAQAVLLAGGTGSRLYPLNSTGTPKALLPVANEPLISFPLRTLEAAGLREVFVICYGETSASKMHSWIQKHYSGRLQLTVKSIPDDSSGSYTAGALRAVAGKLTEDDFVVMSGDVVTDIPLKAVLAAHYVTSATCTSVFTRRKTSPASETKPGKAPCNVDYVGLHDGGRLSFFDSSGDVARRVVKVPAAALTAQGAVTVRTDLVDQHCHVFQRLAVFQALDAKPAISAIKEDLLPYLVRHQSRSSGGAERAGSLSGSLQSGDSLAHGPAWPRARRGSWAGAFLASSEHYCARANTLAAYADVNRDLLSPEHAARFIHQKPNVEGYFRHDSAAVAPRATVGAGCMLGRGCAVGERASVKRSVLGAGCALGAGAKLIGCVLMDRVTVGDEAVVQNCILCSGSHVQVGPDYVISEGSEHREEVFDKTQPSPPA